MSESELMHYGIKGMRWGRRDSDAAAGASAPPKPKRISPPKSKPVASPTRSFSSAPIAGTPAAKSASAPVAKRLPSKPESRMSEADKAHRKKMLIGGAAVVGILGVAAVGVTAYKVSPKAIGAFDNLAVSSRSKVVDLMAHPKVTDLKLSGNQKVSKAKLNVLFKQAELAERGAQGKIKFANRSQAKKAESIQRGLAGLRQETEQLRAANNAADFARGQKLGAIRRNPKYKANINKGLKELRKDTEAMQRSNFAREAIERSMTKQPRLRTVVPPKAPDSRVMFTKMAPQPKSVFDDPFWKARPAGTKPVRPYPAAGRF